MTSRVFLATMMVFLAVSCSFNAILAQTTPPQNPATPPVRAAVVWPPGYIDPAEPAPPYVSPETPVGTGPYKAIMASDPGAPEFVLYHPANLKALGSKKMPIMVWGNGSCAYTGNRFRHFLTEIASHGYLAIAGGPMGDKSVETTSMAQNNPIPKPGDPPSPPRPVDPNRKTVTIDLLERGIDWAIAENARQGSKFYHKLDTRAIAVMGQSCGGVVAIGVGGDPRISTVGVWSSGATMIPSETGAASENLKKLHTPMLYITGDEKYDIAYPGGRRDFENITKLPVFYAWRTNMTHLGTYRQANGGELAPIAIAWLDWHLKGDPSAAKMFKGPNCTLCKDSNWHVQKKKID